MFNLRLSLALGGGSIIVISSSSSISSSVRWRDRGANGERVVGRHWNLSRSGWVFSRFGGLLEPLVTMGAGSSPS